LSTGGAPRALAMKTLDVVCFGEALWDLYEAAPRLGEPIARSFRRELGGAASNAAIALARLGLRAAVVGGVGRDFLGDALACQLAKEGVDTRLLVTTPERTGLTFVTRDAAGEPAFLAYRHDSADMALTRAHIRKAMGRSRWALVGTTTLIAPTLASATARFVRVSRAEGARIAVDLNARRHLWPSGALLQAAAAKLVARASLVKASAADLDAVAKGRGKKWLAEHAPRATWVLTSGPGVASAVGDHGEVRLRARRAHCVDATGAGDAFMAGVLAVLLSAEAVPGSSAWRDPAVWSMALDVGHRLGAKAVGRAGAVAGLVQLGPIRARVRSIARPASR
jgi:fructokinase